MLQAVTVFGASRVAKSFSQNFRDFVPFARYEKICCTMLGMMLRFWFWLEDLRRVIWRGGREREPYSLSWSPSEGSTGRVIAFFN